MFQWKTFVVGELNRGRIKSTTQKIWCKRNTQKNFFLCEKHMGCVYILNFFQHLEIIRMNKVHKEKLIDQPYSNE